MMTVAELRDVLDAVDALPAADIPAAIGALAASQARLLARLVALPTPATAQKLVDAAEMAALLDTPENWVRDRARAGDIPSHRLGHYVRFSPPEVLDAVRRQPRLHDSQLRSVRKAKETRGEKRHVSNGCPSSAAKNTPPNHPGDAP